MTHATHFSSDALRKNYVSFKVSKKLSKWLRTSGRHLVGGSGAFLWCRLVRARADHGTSGAESGSQWRFFSTRVICSRPLQRATSRAAEFYTFCCVRTSGMPNRTAFAQSDLDITKRYSIQTAASFVKHDWMEAIFLRNTWRNKPSIFPRQKHRRCFSTGVGNYVKVINLDQDEATFRKVTFYKTLR